MHAVSLRRFSGRAQVRASSAGASDAARGLADRGELCRAMCASVSNIYLCVYDSQCMNDLSMSVYVVYM